MMAREIMADLAKKCIASRVKPSSRDVTARLSVTVGPDGVYRRAPELPL